MTAAPAALTLLLLAAATPAPAADSRLRAPSELPCSRDQLTSYSGTVTRWQRGASGAVLSIHTDADTRETVRLRLASGEALTARMRIDDAAFTAADWPRIESRPGQLRPGVRATAWICGESTVARIDWAPAR